MSIPGRSHLCWTPESSVGRLACVTRQVSPGRVCHLTSSSLTHSLPVFLDFGSVSPGLLLADCGWTAMSPFLTCHWFLAVFCRAKTSCARILVSQMFFQHLVTGGVHFSLFIQRLVMDILIRFLAPLVLSSPWLAVLSQLFVN